MSAPTATMIDPELEQARRESRYCRLCGGCGQAIVFHPMWDGSRVVDVPRGELDAEGNEISIPTAMEVAAHCRCALGRWIRARTDRDMIARIPDVSEILAGVSLWLLDPPGVDLERAADPGVMKRFFKGWAGHTAIPK